MGLFGKDDPKPANSMPPAQPPRTSSQHSSSTAETTLIGREARIEGILSGSADMLIEGELHGTIESSGRLVIAASGRLEANLHARIVIVSGTVTGNVSADERIELKPSATLMGNITAPKIQIHEGATFEGEVRMAAPETKATSVPSEQPEPGPGELKDEDTSDPASDAKD